MIASKQVLRLRNLLLLKREKKARENNKHKAQKYYVVWQKAMSNFNFKIDSIFVDFFLFSVGFVICVISSHTFFAWVLEEWENEIWKIWSELLWKES